MKTTWLALLAVIAGLVTMRLCLDALTEQRFGQIALDLAVAGAVLWARQRFAADDPPRRAWTLLSTAMVAILVAHGLQLVLPPEAMGLRHVIVALSNLFWIAAVFEFIRTIRASGLIPPAGRLAKVLLAGAVVVALGATGYGIGLLVERVLSEPGALRPSEVAIRAVSPIADGLVFIGAAYLVRVVAPLAGGAIARPFFLIAAGAGIFLGLDVLSMLADVTGYANLEYRLQIVVALGWSLIAAAGWAQAKMLGSARPG